MPCPGKPEFCNGATLWLFFGATILFVVYAILVQNYSYEQALQNKGTQEVTMSKEKKIDKADEIVRKEDRSGQFSDQVKGGRKGNVREERAETEATEPVIRPTEKPKK